MGAIAFMTTSYGKDYKNAYDNAVEDARDYYGSNSYNGTISTTYGCSIYRCEINGNTNWTQTKEKKAYIIARQQLENMEKRECKVIDLGKVSNRITHHNGWHKFLLFGWAAE